MATTNSGATVRRVGLSSGTCLLFRECPTPTEGHAPTGPDALTGWERHRTRQRALEAAAAAAPTAPTAIAAPTAATPAAPTVFSGPTDLAAAAQREWWLGVLARVDASLDDDLAAMSLDARYDAVRDAWAAQVREAPGYLELAALGAGNDGHARTGRRYARLLALFSGRADVADDLERAADVGLDLVREVSASRHVVSAVA